MAWSDRYLVVNWGHNIREFRKNPSYYIHNYKSKRQLARWKKLLRRRGLRLIQTRRGGHRIVRNRPNGNRTPRRRRSP